MTHPGNTATAPPTPTDTTTAPDTPPPAAQEHIEHPWIDPRDLWTEALAGVLARPVRSTLTTLGTILGIATLVITIGVASTAGNQIVGRFDALTATSVSIKVPTPAPGENDTGPLVDWTATNAVKHLAGVTSTAALTDSPTTNSVQVRANDINTPGDTTSQTLAVIAATPGLPTTVHGTMTAGHFYDTGNTTRHDQVAVLGDQAAHLLGIHDIQNAPAIFLKGQAYTVIGILDDIKRERRLSTAVILPPTTAADRLNLTDPNLILINTALGAAQQVARQAPIALAPGHHNALTVIAPPDLSKARDNVQNDVNGLFLVLGLVSLIVGAIGIANVTLVTVMERIGEIGLRRALGASRRQVAAQFLLESTTIGLLGGIVGTALGITTVVTVAITKQWTPVLDLNLAIGAPLAGALVGLIAGLYPSLRAAHMEPVDALRAPS